MIKKIFTFNKGFTLVELMISVGIFALITALLVAKYGTFNQGILLTNLAYDVALTLRTAQSYGLNVKSTPGGTDRYSNEFNLPYGVHFDKGISGTPAPNTQIIFFADNGDWQYTSSDQVISTYNIKRGSKIETICGGTDNAHCNTTLNALDVIFIRPDPDAIMTGNAVYAEITLKSSDGGTKKVIVRRTGQIAVSN